jgi:hypothetical protein
LRNPVEPAVFASFTIRMPVDTQILVRPQVRRWRL